MRRAALEKALGAGRISAEAAELEGCAADLSFVNRVRGGALA